MVPEEPVQKGTWGSEYPNGDPSYYYYFHGEQTEEEEEEEEEGVNGDCDEEDETFCRLLQSPPIDLGCATGIGMGIGEPSRPSLQSTALKPLGFVNFGDNKRMDGSKDIAKSLYWVRLSFRIYRASSKTDIKDRTPIND